QSRLHRQKHRRVLSEPPLPLRDRSRRLRIRDLVRAADARRSAAAARVAAHGAARSRVAMKKMYDDESRDRQHPQRGGKDISPEAPGALEWTCQDPAESLKRMLQYVESEADKAIAWYRQRK